MAVTIDNTGASAGSAAGVSSLNITSFVIASGASLLILGVSQWSAAGTTVTAASCTWNGSQTFTQIGTASVGEGGGTRRVTLLRIISPTAATGTIHVVMSGATDEFVIGATSWNGTDLTTPCGTAQTNTVANTASTSSIVMAGTTTGNVIHDCLSVDTLGAGVLSAGNQTARWRTQAAINTSEGDAQTAAAGGSVTMTWTFPGSAFAFAAHISVELLAAAAGGGAKVPAFLLHESGRYNLRHRQPQEREWARRDRIFIPRHLAEGKALVKAA
jgi:hypothetical protein